MANLYLLIRNLDTEEASGLIWSKNVCDRCSNMIEKKEDKKKVDLYYNFYQSDIMDITCNVHLGGNDYSDLAVIEKKIITDVIGSPKTDKANWDGPEVVGDANKVYQDIPREKYITFLTEALFETYSELVGLPVYEAVAIKHSKNIHWIVNRSDIPGV